MIHSLRKVHIGSCSKEINRMKLIQISQLAKQSKFLDSLGCTRTLQDCHLISKIFELHFTALTLM